MAGDDITSSLLYRVLHAAHAKGTHHKLALGALRHLSGWHADAWRRLFLAHAQVFMDGAKAPDDEFKDFQNHVLHVRDGYWGGAPEKCRNWYEHLVRSLKDGNWSAAVYAAGVLSHYATDPIHPFHTGQTAAENNVHRAVEWSISRSYDGLAVVARGRPPIPLPAAGTGPTWLADFVTAGAEIANRDYERLMAHYDFAQGVVDPPSGLDDVGRALVADLLVYAARSFALILDRALAEAEVTPPRVGLMLETVIATLQIPMKAFAKKLADTADRRAVEAMYDELMATGRVEATLPADDRLVRDLFEADVKQHRERQQTIARALRLPIEDVGLRPQHMQPTNPVVGEARSAATEPMRSSAPPPRSASPAGEASQPNPSAPSVERTAAPSPAVIGQTDAEMPPIVSVEQRPSTASAAIAALAHGTAAMAVARTTPSAISRGRPDPVSAPREAERTSHLAPADDVEAAPSIGPKLAAALSVQGVLTVDDLFAADAERLATALAIKPVTGQTIVDWQDQARLVCDIPGLRGTHAQMLVGAGYRSVSAIAAASPATLSADVLQFAASTDGQRVLRNGAPPDLEKIKGWLTLAIAARAA